MGYNRAFEFDDAVVADELGEADLVVDDEEGLVGGISG